MFNPSAERFPPRCCLNPPVAELAQTASWTAAARRMRHTPALPLLIISIVVFGMSGGMLWLLGLNYEGLSGGAASKIHPSTYLLVGLFGWMAVSCGDPVGYLVRLANLRPASVLLLVAALLMLLHIVVRGAPGMAGDIDTYVGAALAVLLLADAEKKTMRQIEIAIHILMLVNAVMGLGEFLADYRIFPYRFDGEVFPTDLRSTALHGHPLVNATVTSWYVLALIGNGRFSLDARWRAPFIALQYAALVTFGGRAGLVISVVLGGAQMLWAAHRRLRSGRISLPVAAVAVLLLTILPLVAGGLVAGGFFDRLLQRFTDDGGSAYARVLMFELFDRISIGDLLMGPDAAYMDSIRRLAGLEWGIENPIIRTMLYQGLIMTALLTVAVVLFLSEIVRISRPGMAMPMLAFALLLSTSESIGGKTTMLTKFGISILCLYRRDEKNPGLAPAAEGRVLRRLSESAG